MKPCVIIPNYYLSHTTVNLPFSHGFFATDWIQQMPLIKGNGMSYDSEHQLFMLIPESISYETWILGGKKIQIKNEALI